MLAEAIEERTGEFGVARGYINGAVDGLRKAGDQDLLSLGLLGRAELYRLCRKFDAAWRDVEEAREICQRGEMRLYLADCGLEACRLFLAQEQKAKAKEELDRAAGEIEAMGYHRRDGEVEELRGSF